MYLIAYQTLREKSSFRKTCLYFAI